MALTRTRAPRGRTHRLALLACAVLTAGLLPGTGIVATHATASTPRYDGRTFGSPGQALGSGYAASSDRAVVGTGDSTGYHVLVADEKSSFTYHEVADLTQDGLDGIGPWTGYVCVTGSGRYAAAVYAPSAATNQPALMQHGAFAAVINLASGRVTQVAAGVQLAYFSPGCGSGDTVDFTRTTVGDSGHGTTTVLSTDAATGKVLRTRTVQGQLTNPLPTASGDMGVLGGRLVEVGATGAPKAVAKLPGSLFGIAPSANGSVDLALVSGGKDVLHRWNGSKLTRLGSAPLGSFGLFNRAGGDLVAGDVSGIDAGAAPGLVKETAAGKPFGASRQGHLLVTSVASDEMQGITEKVGSPDGRGAGVIRLTGRAAATGTTATTVLATPEATAAATGPDDTEPTVDGQPEKNSLAQSGLKPDPANSGSHYSDCLIKRNDPENQALQPSPNMVVWATDQAVHGDLTLTRPAHFLGTDNGAYVPDSLFPLVQLDGGGTVPAQVILGILAQESNFKQASWHAVPGDGGNPLLGDYYGNADSIHYYPSGAGADCGYGIAQVTSGMDPTKGTTFTSTQATAVATDYATNIAAGVQILSKTWNQLHDLGMKVNSGNATYIENWFMALWGYNSGVYTDASANGGHTGLGWFNNPANPNYPADRQPFLRTSYDDASHPADWPYEEKIMGWIETPQKTYNGADSYTTPQYPDGWPSLHLNGDHHAYCTEADNHCDPSVDAPADACPSEDFGCWWHDSVFWTPADSQATGSIEKLSYPLGSAEPNISRQYPPGDCSDIDTSGGTLLIDDLDDPDDNTQGCHESAQQGGRFTLRLGDSFTMNRPDGTWRATGDISQIDLHQLGAGYDGHIWFTHGYSYKESNYLFHQVIAQWTPDPRQLPAGVPAGQRYDIWVHLPNHGAQAPVRYTINPGPNTSGVISHSCTVNQGNYTQNGDAWVDMGTLPLWVGANLTATNTGYAYSSDTQDVAYDAVMFIPQSAVNTTSPCWNH